MTGFAQDLNVLNNKPSANRNAGEWVGEVVGAGDDGSSVVGTNVGAWVGRIVGESVKRGDIVAGSATLTGGADTGNDASDSTGADEGGCVAGGAVGPGIGICGNVGAIGGESGVPVL